MFSISLLSPAFQFGNLPDGTLLLVIVGAVGLVLVLLGVMIGYNIRQARGSKQSRRKETYKRYSDERIKAIYKLTETLNATLNYQRVLDTSLDLSTSAINQPNKKSNQLVSAVLLFEEQELIVKSARRFTHADKRIKFPGMRGLLGKAINEGEARLGSDPAQDPELGRIVACQKCHSVYCIPLRKGLDIYGILLFSHPEKNYFTGEIRETLNIIAGQAMIAIQNALLYQNLEQEKERLIETQEETRKKLARDLHDGPTQSVAAIAMRLNLARRLLDRSKDEAGNELEKIENLARRTTKEIRHMLFTLRPLVLESQGLTAALQAMAEKMQETYNQNVLIDVNEAIIKDLDIGKQGVIFFIAEEAINNARKHAMADHIWVRLKQSGKDLARLEIQDDGAGFDVSAVESNYENRGSLGMVNLRERAELVNGILQIDSQLGKGTLVQVWIPLTEEAVDRIWHKK